MPPEPMTPPFLFIPGPTPVPDHILSAMAQPSIGHRTPEFSHLWQDITGRLESMLGAKRVFLFSNPATGVWEAVIRNSVVKGALNLVNGAFSGKWHETTEACGVMCEAITKPWGQAFHPEDIDGALSTGKFDTVTLVHNETSTGVASPIEPIAELIQRKYPDVLLHVDAVSSMAAVEIRADEWGLASCFASLQKAWNLPPGFTVCAVSDKLLDRSASISAKGYYFDMHVYDTYYRKQQTPATPSLPHMYGLQAVLSDIAAEGLDARYGRHLVMAQTVRQWAVQHGQSLYAEPGCESVTLTAIRNDAGWDVQALYEALEKEGYRMDRGYGKLRGEVFRIAHMGAVTPHQVETYLATIDRLVAA